MPGFSYPAAPTRPGGDEEMRHFLLVARARQFAGTARKASVGSIARWLRDPDPPPCWGRPLLRTLFQSVRPYERWPLLGSGGTLLELASRDRSMQA